MQEWVNTHTVNAQTNIEIVTILPGTINTSLAYTGIYGGNPNSAFSKLWFSTSIMSALRFQHDLHDLYCLRQR